MTNSMLLLSSPASPTPPSFPKPYQEMLLAAAQHFQKHGAGNLVYGVTDTSEVPQYITNPVQLEGDLEDLFLDWMKSSRSSDMEDDLDEETDALIWKLEDLQTTFPAKDPFYAAVQKSKEVSPELKKLLRLGVFDFEPSDLIKWVHQQQRKTWSKDRKEALQGFLTLQCLIPHNGKARLLEKIYEWEQQRPSSEDLETALKNLCEVLDIPLYETNVWIGAESRLARSGSKTMTDICPTLVLGGTLPQCEDGRLSKQNKAVTWAFVRIWKGPAATQIHGTPQKRHLGRFDENDPEIQEISKIWLTDTTADSSPEQ